MGLNTMRTLAASPRQRSALFGGAAWSIAANINYAAAQAAAKPVVRYGGTAVDYPLWQITYALSVVGGTNTATLRMHYLDVESEWHFIGILALRNAFVVGDQDSQFIEIAAPSGAVSVAMQLDDYTDGTWSIKVRGVV